MSGILDGPDNQFIKFASVGNDIVITDDGVGTDNIIDLVSTGLYKVTFANAGPAGSHGYRLAQSATSNGVYTDITDNSINDFFTFLGGTASTIQLIYNVT